MEHPFFQEFVLLRAFAPSRDNLNLTLPSELLRKKLNKPFLPSSLQVSNPHSAPTIWCVGEKTLCCGMWHSD
jgi:hypothetical protein